MIPSNDVKPVRNWPAWRLGVIGLSVLALALSAYLSWHALMGGKMIGCSGGSTCDQVLNMSKMIQIRHVPEELHRRLKSVAAQAGMSLSDYLLNEIRLVAERPTWEEFRARLARRPPLQSSISPAEIIREMRDRE